MGRISKDHDERYAEFVDVARDLFFSHGYECTTVQEIIDTVGVAKGTFYHYFDSKEDVLEAIVAELSAEHRAIFEAIVADKTLSATQKWTRAFAAVGHWSAGRKGELLALVRAMQKNVLLSYRLREQETRQALPMMSTIIAEGIEEGLFDTEHLAETAEIVYGVSRIVSALLIPILLHPEDYEDAKALARRKVAAGQVAIERILGAPPGSLLLLDEEVLAAWFRD